MSFRVSLVGVVRFIPESVKFFVTMIFQIQALVPPPINLSFLTSLRAAFLTSLRALTSRSLRHFGHYNSFSSSSWSKAQSDNGIHHVYQGTRLEKMSDLDSSEYSI